MSRPIILLVDDEKTILDSLRAELRTQFGRRFGYETAESAPEAWEVIEELVDRGVRVVVVVSDWLMPGMRGDEFLARVRASHPAILRIMLTGQADASAIQRAHDEAHVFEVMHKPWSADDLRSTIERGIASAG